MFEGTIMSKKGKRNSSLFVDHYTGMCNEYFALAKS